MNKRDPEKPVVKATVLLASTLIVMVTGVIVPALPAVQAHFAQAPNVAFWVRMVLTLPSLFIAATAPIAGYVVDRVGRKTVLLTSTLVLGIAGVAGYLAPTLTSLLISRAGLGIAVGALMTSLTTLIADYYSGAARGRFMGLQAAFMGFGGTASLALGGLLADVGWRVPFLTYSLALAVLPLSVLALYEPLLGEQCAGKLPLLSDPGACAAESIHATRRIDSVRAVAPSAPLRLMLFLYLVTVGIQIVLFLLPMQLPFYLLHVMGASASRSGLAISMMSVSYALASMQYGRVASWLDHSKVLTVAFALVGAGFLLIGSAGGWAIMLLGLLLAGTGQGLLSPNLTVWLAGETPLALRGRVMGGLTTTVFLGIFLSPLVGEPVSAAIGFRALCLSAGAVLLVLASLFWVTRDQLRSLTSCIPLELRTLGTDTGEVETAAELHGLDVALNADEGVGRSPVRESSHRRRFDAPKPLFEDN
jgi:MFS family permease